MRSTWVAALATVAVAGGLTYLDASASSSDPGFDPVRSLGFAVPFATVGLLVLGVLVGTSEFSTGNFRSTFVAVPRRLSVLAGQVLAMTVFAALVAVLAVGSSVLAILPSAASRGITPDLGGDGVLRNLIGSVVLLSGTGLVGAALGAWVRRPVAALVAAVGICLVLPMVLVLAADLVTDPLAASAAGGSSAPESPLETFARFTPTGAADSLLWREGGALQGVLVLAGWLVLPLTAAAIRLSRRDLV